ncbi:MAG: hypothetical protein KC417_13575, partial [Myxococcales bacterium]|nr:hypothetical protein [Myxococcales bacterium]
GYMAPEQFAKGSAEVDARADVFALGVCFYEALVGKPLFERESHAETMAAIVVGELPAPPSHERADIPMSVDAVFRRAVARHVGDRYATADDFARDLERAAASDPAGPVRATALAALLDAVFPGERDAAPTLDRTPIAGLEQERAKAARDLERPSMEAELDQLSDEVASASKRKQRMLIVLAVAVVLLAALAVAMAVMNAPSPGGPASPVPGAVEP